MKTDRSFSRYRNLYLPAVVFILVWVIHYIWLGLFPEEDPSQGQWVSLDGIVKVSWWSRYIETQSYYLGFSYSLSLSFATVALRKYRESRSCRTGTLAVGGVSLSSFLAVASCYLIGCCGSPMLAVYLSLFGAAFLPWAKPAIAVLTAALIAIAWWLMKREGPVRVSQRQAS